MGDQRLVGIDRIVNELKKINTSIQKTKTYKDGNTFGYDASVPGFGGASIVNSSGVSAFTLALLGVITLVPGSTGASSGVGGTLDSQPGCDGSSAGASSTDGILSVLTELGSSVVETSGASALLGSMDTTFSLRGSIAGASNVSAAIREDREVLRGESDGESNTTGILDSQNELAGSCDGESSGAAAYLWT